MPAKTAEFFNFRQKEYKTPIVVIKIITLEIKFFKFFQNFFEISAYAHLNTQYIVLNLNFSHKKGGKMAFFA